MFFCLCKSNGQLPRCSNNLDWPLDHILLRQTLSYLPTPFLCLALYIACSRCLMNVAWVRSTTALAYYSARAENWGYIWWWLLYLCCWLECTQMHLFILQTLWDGHCASWPVLDTGRLPETESLPSRSLLFLSDRYEKRQLQIIKGIEKLKLSKKCRMMFRFLVWATDLGY